MNTIDEDMLEFFRRSVDGNTATGVPRNLPIVSEITTFDLPPTAEDSRVRQPPTVVDQVFAPPQPSLISIDPTSGPIEGGTTITIRGTGFTSGSKVRIDTTEIDPTFVSTEELTVVTEAHAADLVDVAVENVPNDPNYADVFEDAYTFIGAQLIIDPNYGEPTRINFGAAAPHFRNGSGFVAGTTVDFGGVPGTNVVIIDSTHLICDSPIHVPGWVVAKATNPGGGILTGNYDYQPHPTDNPLGMTFHFPNPGLPEFYPAMFQGSYQLLVRLWFNGAPYNTFHGSVGAAILATAGLVSSFVQSVIPMNGGIGYMNIGAAVMAGAQFGEFVFDVYDNVYGGISPALYHYGTPGPGRPGTTATSQTVRVYP